MRALVLSLAVALFNISSVAEAKDLFIPQLSNVVSNIKGAYFNEKSRNLEVDLSYVGGCYQHEFELRVDKCYEEDVNVCYVDVVRVAGFEDSCKRIVNKQVVFPLENQFIGVDELVISNVSVELR